MNHDRIVRPLEVALRVYAVLAFVIVLFQATGLLMYLINVWPSLSGVDGATRGIPSGVVGILGIAVVMGFVRSVVWIRIYWDGATVFALLRAEDQTVPAEGRIARLLSRVGRLLVLSCLLDVFFLPAYFMSDTFLPFPVAGWRLGIVEVARVLFPQAFGVAALILAFLARTYGRLLREQRELKSELELTV